MSSKAKSISWDSPFKCHFCQDDLDDLDDEQDDFSEEDEEEEDDMGSSSEGELDKIPLALRLGLHSSVGPRVVG